MVRSQAETVDQYLAELPPERREVVSTVRDLVLRHLPEGYVETMNWGMISYEIPLSRYANTHNKQPLSYAALAAQKNYYSLYLMTAYADSEQEGWIKDAYAQAGKKLDMGKSCLRFRKLEDVMPRVIARVIASTPPDEFIAMYVKSRKK